MRLYKEFAAGSACVSRAVTPSLPTIWRASASSSGRASCSQTFISHTFIPQIANDFSVGKHLKSCHDMQLSDD